MNKSSAIFALTISLLLIVGAASAANFGSVAKNDRISLEEGQKAFFRLLFWSSESITQKVSLSVISSPGWEINFDKNDFNLSSLEGNEMVFSSGYIQATSVVVTADTKNSPPGNYTIMIAARSRPINEDISFDQERQFTLGVIIKASGRNITETEKNNAMEENKTGSQAKKTNDITSFHWAIAGLLIIFILWLLYRYSKRW